MKSPQRERGDFLNHTETLQAALDYIEENITEALDTATVAEKSGYSAYYFSRMFKAAIGISVMSYVTWRKLQHALYDLSMDKKVIDAAMDYGFETHAGFTKAFVRWFGFPPSLCHLHLSAKPPAKPHLNILKNRFSGGNAMHPHIMEITPLSVVGYPSRHTKANMQTTHDAPMFWSTINLDYGPLLTKLHDIFRKSKHCEISMCYDVDEATGDFTYLLGRGIDNPADLDSIQPDMTRVDIAGGLYAIFSTPLADDEGFVQSAQDTWDEIFTSWLPQSEFEFDKTRQEFEYHDHRDHGWYFGGKVQIDICIPIRQREEEKRKAKLRRDR